MGEKNTLVQKLKKILESISPENIRCKNHSFLRFQGRGIRHDETLEILTNPTGLYKAFKEKADYPGEEKYKLYFRLSNRYDLVIVLLLQNSHIEIVTTYTTNKKIKIKPHKRRR